jgi:hypothetical protein
VRNKTTSGSSENIVRLSDIRHKKLAASSHFGPLKPASTTLLAQEIYRANQEARLTELLSSLESVVADLNSKSYTVLDTLIIAIQEARVALSASIPGTTGIEKICENCGDDLVAEGQGYCLDCLETVL